MRQQSHEPGFTYSKQVECDEVFQTVPVNLGRCLLGDLSCVQATLSLAEGA